MNRPVYLKLIAFVVLIAGLSIAYSWYSTPKIETIRYKELDVCINTPKLVYEVGEEINATVYLRNQNNYTVYVEPFRVDFFGYMKGEGTTGIIDGSSKQTQGITEIAPLNDYRVILSLFIVEEAGLLNMTCGGVTEHVYVIDGLDEKYWNMKPELLDDLLSPNDNPEVDLSNWFAVASKLRSINNTARLDYFPYIFVQMYPDWINDTAYVALSDTREEFTQPILEQFNPSIREDIRFIKAPTTLPRLKRWEQIIWNNHDVLEENGVMLTSSTIYFDGRIMLGVEDADEEKVAILSEILVDVPPGILVVVPMGPIILN